MNQERIGKFISQRRKDLKLKQKDLADKLHISEKTISKWECGKGLPEVSLMQPLCKELNITVNELLNGESDNKEEKAIVEYVKYEKKKSNKKVAIITVIAILLITFILSTVIYFFNSYNKIAVYSISGTGKNFTVEETILTTSNMYNILNPGKIVATNDEYTDSEIISYQLKCDETIIVGGAGEIKNSTFSPIVEKNGYNEVLSPYKIQNLDKWKMIIKYRIKGKVYTETIPLKNKVIMKNNEFVSLKVSSIDKNTTNYETEENFTKNLKKEKEKTYNKYKKLLSSEGYIPVKEEKYQLKKTISENEYLILYTDLNELEHHIQKDEDHMNVRGTLLPKSSSEFKRDRFGISVYLYENGRDYHYGYHPNIQSISTDPDQTEILFDKKELKTYLDEYEKLQDMLFKN